MHVHLFMELVHNLNSSLISRRNKKHALVALKKLKHHIVKACTIFILLAIFVLQSFSVWQKKKVEIYKQVLWLAQNNWWKFPKMWKTLLRFWRLRKKGKFFSKSKKQKLYQIFHVSYSPNWVYEMKSILGFPTFKRKNKHFEGN